MAENTSRNGSARSDQSVRAVERAVAIMDALLRAGPSGVRVSQLSRELALHKTTVVRLLRTLVNVHLARKDEGRECYVWEPITWVGLLHTVKGFIAPIDRIEEVMSDLTAATGVTSLLGHPDPSGRRMGIALRVVPAKGVHVDPGAFRRPPMHCTAAGKAYLSRSSQTSIKCYVEAGLAKLTPHTITSADRLLSELDKARSRGYATTLEECIEGTAGIGVAVLDSPGKAVAGLQLSILREQALPRNFESWAPLLSTASRRLTEILYAEDTGGTSALDMRSTEVASSLPRIPDGQRRIRRPYRVV
ncbi:MAG: helix-turn-helix domain-containing protein [Armatimonadetes bacterium]|nr:helix-turn-helix domain-containing protein [Armatimonadota bacterium]